MSMYKKGIQGLLTAGVAVGFAGSVSAASINELRVDQSGADNDEYIELFGAANESLDGLSFIVLQDNGVIDDVVDLSGQSLGSDGLFLIAEASSLPAFAGAVVDLVEDINLENGENSSYILASSFTGSAGDDLDADDDGVFDAVLPFTILDAISLVDDEDTILDGGTEDIDYSVALGATLIGPDGTFFPGSVAAFPNGSDTFIIQPFDVADANSGTPGALNIPEPASLALVGLGSLAMLGRRRRA